MCSSSQARADSLSTFLSSSSRPKAFPCRSADRLLLYTLSASPLSLLYAPSPPQSSARNAFPPSLVKRCVMMAMLGNTEDNAHIPWVQVRHLVASNSEPTRQDEHEPAQEGKALLDIKINGCFIKHHYQPPSKGNYLSEVLNPSRAGSFFELVCLSECSMRLASLCHVPPLCPSLCLGLFLSP